MFFTLKNKRYIKSPSAGWDDLKQREMESFGQFHVHQRFVDPPLFPYINKCALKSTGLEHRLFSILGTWQQTLHSSLRITRYWKYQFLPGEKIEFFSTCIMPVDFDAMFLKRVSDFLTLKTQESLEFVPLPTPRSHQQVLNRPEQW